MIPAVSEQRSSSFPVITVLQPDESRLRRILNLFSYYLPFLKSFVDWIAPDYQSLSDNGMVDAIMGRQSLDQKSSIARSGRMHGCHLVISISPDGKMATFSHNNPFIACESACDFPKQGAIPSTRMVMDGSESAYDTQVGWKHYLFMTQKTKNESGMGQEPTEQFYTSLVKEWYGDHISHIVYVDDTQGEASDVEYDVKSRTMKVKMSSQYDFASRAYRVWNYTFQLTPPTPC